MTKDVRRECFEDHAPQYANEAFAGDGLSAAAVTVRRAGPDDAAGVAAVLNGVIAGGSPTLLDTPVSVEEERAYIEGLPARSFLHVAEAAGAGVVGFQTVIPWNTFLTTEFDHVATMGTYVDAAHRRQGVGAALARSSFVAALALGYDKIFTDLRADNLDSLAYHLALGFGVVGTARRHARVRDVDVDVLFIERFLREG
jgi:L-amino acid N-acyltransferase YncA